MLSPIRTNQFKKDIKSAHKQGKDMSILKEIMKKIVLEENLDPKLKDHSLKGNYKGSRELHLKPDWLLVYRTTDTEVYFERTGSHSELFKK